MVANRVVSSEGHPDPWELVSRIAVLASFFIAVLVYVAAPLLALSWRHNPFPGFLVQPRLVVSVTNGEGWAGRAAGLSSPQLVVRVDGQSVQTTGEYERVIAAQEIGDEITVFVRTPDGKERLYPDIPLVAIRSADMMRLFGLPYLIGLAYLVIGGWIYRIRGSTRPGRALAFMCTVAATALGVVFDLYSTHVGALIYTGSMALVGATFVSLAWRFPDEWTPVKRRPWILALPYAVSAVFAIRGLYAVMDPSDPWAFITAWFTSYIYAAAGIMMLVAMVLYRSWAGTTVLIRRQARVILAGSILAFTPITIWFLLPIFGIVTFHPLFVFPALIIFPISVAVAILRFRLWEVDTLVSNAFVYGMVTAILAGVFAALSTLTQKTFVLITGERSDAAIVLTTLIIAAAFAPLKTIVQSIADRELKGGSENIRALQSFAEEVHTHAQLSDVSMIADRLLTEVTRAYRAESGSVGLVIQGRLQTLHTYGMWKGDCRMSIPLEYRGQRYGILELGPPMDGTAYSRDDSQVLKHVAQQVSAAIAVYWPAQNPNWQEEVPSTAGSESTNGADAVRPSGQMVQKA